MIVKEEFLNRLKDFGLNSYESKLWTSLLSRGVASAGELSDIANVPRSRTYDVLESLEKKGFIVMKIGKPIKYIAVPPEEVVERVKKKINEDASEQTSMLDEFKNSKMLEELNLLHSKGVDMVDPSEKTAALKGRKNLYNHFESLINKAESSVVLMTTEEGLIRKSQALQKSLQNARKRGVAIKIASNLSEDSQEKLCFLNELASVRHTDNVQGRFMVVDDRDVLFTLIDGEDTHPTYDSGIWSSAPFFAQTLSSMFHNLWGDMKPICKK